MYKHNTIKGLFCDKRNLDFLKETDEKGLIFVIQNNNVYYPWSESVKSKTESNYYINKDYIQPKTIDDANYILNKVLSSYIGRVVDIVADKTYSITLKDETRHSDYVAGGYWYKGELILDPIGESIFTKEKNATINAYNECFHFYKAKKIDLDKLEFYEGFIKQCEDFINKDKDV